MKALAVVLGILVIIAGIVIAFTPLGTAFSLMLILGIAIVILGISNLCTYSEKKKNGQASGWTIFGAIVSILFGLFMVFSDIFRLDVALIVTILIGAWLFVYGVFTIVAACKIHGLAKANPDGELGKNWGWGLALGIVMVLFGLLVMGGPLVSFVIFAEFSALFVGIVLIVAGINTIALAFTE